MTTHEKIAVKRRDLTANVARQLELRAEVDALVGGPGYADRKKALEAQLTALEKQADQLKADQKALTQQLQPRLL